MLVAMVHVVVVGAKVCLRGIVDRGNVTCVTFWTWRTGCMKHFEDIHHAVWSDHVKAVGSKHFGEWRHSKTILSPFAE